MKKSIWVVLLSLAFALVGCKYDDSELQDKVKGIDERVTALEQKVQDLNTTAVGIQSAITALQSQLYVSKVVVNRDADGNPVTYDITFSDGTSITLHKGLKGDQGEIGPQGDQGEVGPMPELGVELIDGLYYWTVEGELLKDAEGNPIPVVGPQGERGYTPKFKIDQGSWWVSYDDEATWERVGLVSDTETSVIVTEYEDYIELDINGVKVNIPKEKPFRLVVSFEGDLGSVGINANETLGLAYTVEGLSEGEEATVDVLSTTAGISAKVTPTDGASGYIMISTTDVTSGKIFVYADNNKGKTSIKSITLEEGVLTAVADVTMVEPEGAEIALTVETNVEYDAVVSDGAESWLSVAPATKATHTDELVIVVAPNTAGAYRSGTVSVVNRSTGETAQSFDIVQKPAADVETDLASIRTLADGTEVEANGSIVIAASQEGSLVSDGDAYLYITTATPLSLGDKVTFAGVKKTNEETDVEYVETTTVTVESSGNEYEDLPWNYIGLGGNFDSINTGTSGVLEKDATDGSFYLSTPYIEKVVLETPLAAFNMDSFVGKYVTIEGYTNGVTKDEVYHFILNAVSEITFSVNPSWTVSYDGEYQSSYEQFTNTVSSPSDYFAIYGMKVYTKAQLEEAGSVEALAKKEILSVADNVQFYFYMYDEGIEDNASTETASWISRKEDDYGEFIAFAVGLNEKGYPTGKYAYVEFEKVDPHVNAAYEDYLGKWTVGKATWEIAEKVNGQTYSITGINGQDGFPAVEGVYADGKFTVSEAELGTTEEGTQYLTAIFQYGSSKYLCYPYNSATPNVAFTGSMLQDGTVDMIPGSCNYGGFVSFLFLVRTASGNTQSAVTTLPNVMTPYDPSQESDPLQEEYTADDKNGSITKDELFGTTWRLYCRPMISGSYEEDRAWYSNVTVTEAEDVEDDSDRVLATGLSLGVQENDPVYLEYYNGTVYSLGQSESIGTYTNSEGTTYYDRFVALNPTSEQFSRYNYYNFFVRVADGLYALVPNADGYTGFAVMGYSDEALTTPAVWRLRYKDVLLVNPA